jgi:hypothetical protein
MGRRRLSRQSGRCRCTWTRTSGRIGEGVRGCSQTLLRRWRKVLRPARHETGEYNYRDGASTAPACTHDYTSIAAVKRRPHFGQGVDREDPRCTEFPDSESSTHPGYPPIRIGRSTHSAKGMQPYSSGVGWISSPTTRFQIDPVKGRIPCAAATSPPAFRSR